MRNTVMTGPIILSKEDSSRLRQNILRPTVEYLQEQERYFEEIASSMIIHKEGSNTRVEFKDLDLSNLDLMIEKEKNEMLPLGKKYSDTVILCPVEER